MTKQTTTILVLAALGVATYMIWKNQPKPTPAASNTTPTPAPTPAPSGCTEGLTPCANGNGCYDPKINYFTDPCAGATTNV